MDPKKLEEFAGEWLTRNGLDKLRDPEKGLLGAVQDGKRFEGGDGVVRAALIRYLCGNKEARELVDPSGISMARVTVEGEERADRKSALALSSFKIPFPFIFETCTLPDLLLHGVEIPFLSLEGCTVTCILADVLSVRDLYLRNGFKSKGELKFSGAKIGGDFDLKGAMLNVDGTESVALNGEGITVSGDLLMTDFEKKGFVAGGKVWLDGAKIEGDFNCDHASFDNLPAEEKPNRDGVALSFRHATVGGDVLLGRGFSAKGAVRLPGGIIGGSLDCAGGSFDNPRVAEKVHSGVALEVDGTEVKLDLFLAKGRDSSDFAAIGTVSLVGAKIGKTLHCKTGHFNNVKAADVKDEKSPRWRPALDLSNAKTAYFCYPKVSPNDHGTSANPDNVYIESGQLRLDGFLYDRISEGAKTSEECLKWIDLQTGKERSLPQPFLQLAKALRDEGHFSAARETLFAMERSRPTSRISALWLFAKRITIGYGYYPWWAFYWLGGLCLIGWLIFLLGKEHFELVKDHRSIFNPFLYSFENTIPLIKFGQVDSWHTIPVPFPKDIEGLKHWILSWDGLLGIFRVFQIVFGWFLTTMGVAGLTGLVRKD